MGVLLFLATVVTIAVLAYALFLKNQRRLIFKQLLVLELLPEQKIDIQYTYSQFGALTVIAAYPMKAQMYITDSYIFIIPGTNHFLNILNLTHLPILFTIEKEVIESRNSIFKAIKAKSICRTGASGIKIEFQRESLVNLTCIARIKILDKNKFIETTINWC